MNSQIALNKITTSLYKNILWIGNYINSLLNSDLSTEKVFLVKP